MNRIYIRDSLMGTGKSTKMIEEINNSPKEQRWMIVTPFLAECHRYAGTIADEDSERLQKPKTDDNGRTIYTGGGCSATNRQFKHPVKTDKTKVENIEKLVENGENIVTTHAALKLFSPSTLIALKDAGYRLVIDEELECIKPFPLQQHRKEMALKSGALYIDQSGLLRWSEDFALDTSIEDGMYSWESQLKRLCDNGSLVMLDDTRNMFMWEYPSEFMKAFDRVDVLTFLFDGSVFQKYLDCYSIPYVVEYGIQAADKGLFNIVDGKMNDVGNRDNIFSATDQRKYTKDSSVSKTIKLNLSNFFRSGGSNYDDRMWTCLEESRQVFKGQGYTKRWLASNTKAINDYSNVTHAAYIYNSYLHPEVYKYLGNKGFHPDGDRWALSEMLQWIYRSGVRNNNPIELYVPSLRMRQLLNDFLST